MEQLRAAQAKGKNQVEKMKCAHVFVSGRVQGVFFRAFAKSEADRLGLKGFARNLDDRRVEVVAEGSEGTLKEFIETLRARHPTAKVNNIEIKWGDATGEFDDFKIRR